MPFAARNVIARGVNTVELFEAVHGFFEQAAGRIGPHRENPARVGTTGRVE
jgi:hypothetical protein